MPTKRELAETLNAAKIDLDRAHGVMTSGAHSLADVTRAIAISDGKTTTQVALPSLGALFTGERVPPSMRGEPPIEYQPFFLRIELTSAAYCAKFGPVHDREFERLYRQLRRFPDGTDKHPLFGALQQTGALHASLHDVSRAEYEAVMDRLSRSARTFDGGPGSTNYWKHALSPLLDTIRL